MSTDTKTRKLSLNDILDHRAYERVREASRANVIELKRRRRILASRITHDPRRVVGGVQSTDLILEIGNNLFELPTSEGRSYR